MPLAAQAPRPLRCSITRGASAALARQLGWLRWWLGWLGGCQGRASSCVTAPECPGRQCRGWARRRRSHTLMLPSRPPVQACMALVSSTNAVTPPCPVAMDWAAMVVAPPGPAPASWARPGTSHTLRQSSSAAEATRQGLPGLPGQWGRRARPVTRAVWPGTSRAKGRPALTSSSVTECTGGAPPTCQLAPPPLPPIAATAR
ncbi:hypothetical protein V8C86DRAFT_2613100 [Haematococcus lacustris]